MAFDPDVHHRRSIRLRNYDYTTAGAYFITICAYQRGCLFGEVVDGVVRLNGAGNLVDELWRRLPGHYPDIRLDEFVAMPNHFHGIIFINNPVGARFIAPESTNTAPGNNPVGARFIAPESTNTAPGNNPVRARFIAPESTNTAPGNQGAMNQGAMNRAPTVGEIVRAFKARCTHAINALRHTPGAPVWQRNYYERVIRDDRELDATRQYIVANPTRWAEDENHPLRV